MKINLPLWPVSGVYAIYGDEMRVYVGESMDIWHRESVQWAIRLGWFWELVCKMPDSTKKERQREEAKAKVRLLRQGFNVVSLTVREASQAAHAKMTPEERRDRSRKVGLAVQAARTLEQRREFARRGGRA